MQFFPILGLLAVAKAILVPGPTGPFSVAMHVQPLTDASRLDPFAPVEHPHNRRILVSMFLPIETKKGSCSVSKVPYMTPEVAAEYGTLASSVGLPNDTFRGFELEFCEPLPSTEGRHKKTRRSTFPLAIFSPGYGESRLLYGAMARSLASQGYVVATVDHPYDATVEFPDGSIIRAADLSDDDATLEKVVKVRAADISFVIDQLHKASPLARLLSGFPDKVDLSKIVVFGHSLGGAAAAETMLQDDRVRGGVNFDGRLVNPVMDAGLDGPFLLAGRPNHRLEDPTWDEFWANLRGSKAQLGVSGTAHGSYTDLPVLIGSLGLPEEVMEAVVPLLGSIDSKRLDEVRNGILVSFFDFVFWRQSAALRKIGSRYSEVSIVDSRLPKTSC